MAAMNAGPRKGRTLRRLKRCGAASDFSAAATVRALLVATLRCTLSVERSRSIHERRTKSIELILAPTTLSPQSPGCHDHLHGISQLAANRLLSRRVGVLDAQPQQAAKWRALQQCDSRAWRQAQGSE